MAEHSDSAHTQSIDHWPFIVSLSPCEIPKHTENQDCRCYQYSVFHITGIDGHVRRPEAEEQDDENIDDRKQVDRGSYYSGHIQNDSCLTRYRGRLSFADKSD